MSPLHLAVHPITVCSSSHRGGGVASQFHSSGVQLSEAVTISLGERTFGLSSKDMAFTISVDTPPPPRVARNMLSSVGLLTSGSLLTDTFVQHTISQLRDSLGNDQD